MSSPFSLSPPTSSSSSDSSAIGTFVLLLGNGIFEAVYVGTRKISDKWGMTLHDLAEVDVTGSSVKQTHQMHQPQQFA